MLFYQGRARAVDSNGRPVINAKLYFYRSGTTDTEPVYSDNELTVPHTQPVRSNAAGFYPPIYLDPLVSYKSVETTAADVALPGGIIDPISFLNEDLFNALLVRSSPFAQTQSEIDANITPVNLTYLPGNIRRYGAVCDGITDDSPAFRKSLDLAARAGVTVVCEPPGTIKLNSTIYLPQRLLGLGIKGYLISLYGSTIVGQGRGVGTVFETGTGTLSTGGSTNFGQANESDQALHYGLVIKGARFRSCQRAFRLFNFTKGCKIEDIWFEDLDTAVYTFRSFYAEFYNLHAQIVSITAGHVLFDFNDVSNAMTIIGCEAGGGSGNTAGIGYRFTGGGSGIIFHNNTAEALDKGLVIAGQIDGLGVDQCYFEAIASTAIDATNTGSKIMDIGSNWFLSCTEAIDAIQWVRGTFSRGQFISGTGGTVRINDADSTCTVEVPLQAFGEVGATASAARLPSNYVLSNSVVIDAPRLMFVEASGFNFPIAVEASYNKSVPSFYYSGGNVYNGAGFTIPFVTQTLSAGSSVLDTQIIWSDYLMVVVFDFYTEINAIARRFRGIVYAGGFVDRADSLSNFTVVASNNSDKLRITVAGSDHATFTSVGYIGQIRHV